MNNLIVLIISILPVYLIGLYVYKKDKEKESKVLLRNLFLLGMISCIPAAIVEVILEPFFGAEENMSLIFLFLYVLIAIALIEELCKWFIVYKKAYNNKEFDHIYDAVVYCVFVSLGFACLENVLYVSLSGIIAGILRAITAVPGHVSDAVIMGNYMGLAKQCEILGDEKGSSKNLLFSLLIPTFNHAIYDYCLFTESVVFFFIFIAFLIFIYVYSIKKIKKLSNIKNILVNDYVIVKDKMDINYCPNCGNKVMNSNFCSNCGQNLHTINIHNNLTQ